MPEQQDTPRIDEQLIALIHRDDATGVHDYLRALPPEDTPYTLSHLSDTDREELFRLVAVVDPDLSADLLEHLPDELVADVLSELDEQVAAKIVDEMDSDEQVDALAKLEPEETEAILDEMTPEEARDVRERLDYPAESAAGVMITEYLAYLETMTIGEIIDDLRANSDEYKEYEVRYLYSINEAGLLTGVARMRALLMRAPNTRFRDIVATLDPDKVLFDEDLDDLKDIFDRVDHMAVPVVDGPGKLLGIVQRAAVEEAISERESRNLMKFGGILGGRELRSNPLIGRTFRRLAFLMPNVLLSYIAVSVIGFYEPVIEQLTALAIFLPMVANLSGAAGNQAVAVSIRELALGLIDERDMFLVWRKEILVGVINGIILGLMLTLVTLTMRHEQPMLAGLIGVSYALTSVLAVTCGGGLPLVLQRIGVDPAMLSSPILTTLTDLFSFATVLTLAATVILHAG
jgi:magnesium transporter